MPRDRVGVRVNLLGGFETRLASGAPLTLPTRKAQALIAYLAVRPGHLHPREMLAALLWADRGEAQARDSLRHTLVELRKALPDPAATLITEGRALGLDPARVDVDVVTFEAGVADGTVERLAGAVDVYRGDFLEGFVLREARFEEWLVGERERLREAAMSALRRVLEHQRAVRGVEPAIRTALRLLALDATQEPVHRALMQLYAQQGRRADVLRQYQACVAVLQHELGTEPDGETRRLYQEILQRREERERRAHPAPPVTSGITAPAGPAFRHDLLGGEAPLVGRAAELASLRNAFAEAQWRRGGLVAVVGEAGIGKSRLVAELAAEVSPAAGTVLVGRAYASTQSLPFGTWVDAIRCGPILLDGGTLDTLDPAWKRELARLFPELSGPPMAGPGDAGSPVRLYEAMVRLVQHIASERPLLLVLEDLHWGDESSVQLLAFVARRIAQAPVLIVATVREEELADVARLREALQELDHEQRLTTLTLRPLSRADTAVLTRALAAPSQDSVAPELEEQVWATSSGNPFTVVETLRAVREGVLQPAGGLTPPQRVQAVITARLDRLSPRGREAIAAASVIGRAFDFQLLRRTAGLDERAAAEAIEELVRRRVLHSVGGGFEVMHDWIRHVAYERLLPSSRAILHAAVGQALEAIFAGRLDEVADQLGDHYSKARDAGKALPHLLRFAELATERYALEDAVRVFQQALAMVDDLPPAERGRRRLEVVLRQAFLLSIIGHQRQILELLGGHAADVEATTDARLVAEYYARLGLTHFFLGDHAASQRAGERALREAERADDAEATGKALHVLSLTAFEVGRPQDGIAHARRAIAILEGTSATPWLALAHHDLALNSVIAGDLDQALLAADAEDALGQVVIRARALAGCVKTWALALKGDHAAAIETGAQALDHARDPAAAGLVSGALALAYLESGDARPAIELLSKVVEWFRNSPMQTATVRYLTLLAEAHRRAGNTALALETADRAVTLSDAAGMPFNVGDAVRVRGRIAQDRGELGSAAEHFSRALDAFTRCGAAFEAARTRVERARVRGEQGATEDARSDLDLARAAFEASNAPRRVAEARDLARSLGLAG